MTNPTRITVAFDQPTARLLEKLSQEAELRLEQSFDREEVAKLLSAKVIEQWLKAGKERKR